MSVRNILMAAAGSADDKLYVDDVFSAYTYTGNDSTQTINNGIDLAGKGGMVWIKGRNTTLDNMVVDTVRGVGQHSSLQTNANNSTTDFTVWSDFTAFNSNGFTLGNPAWTSRWNSAPYTYISWTFRKAPKFFDVVTYTGNGANRTIPHALGQEVGMMLVKRTDAATDWQVYHRSLANTEYMVLNSTAAKATGATRWNSTTATTSNISLGADATVNASGGTYVAYLFAHDTSADGIIQCGASPAGNPSGKVALGWEPQYLLFKPTLTTGDWYIVDNSRGVYTEGGPGSIVLNPNSTAAEAGFNNVIIDSTGFKQVGLGVDYIYLAIRRPNKPPTTGTEVYNHLTRTGTGAVGSTAAVGFAPDLAISQSISAGRVPTWVDRLRGVKRWIRTDVASPEQTQTTSGLSSFDMLGVSYTVDNTEQPFAWNNSGEDKHQRFFRRAPGFMDVVCDDGTATAHAIAHNMTVAPELVIRKSRDVSSQWGCWHAGIANTEKLVLNSTAAKATDTTAWNSTSPTPASFTVGTGANVNMKQAKYVTYLFATKAGISKVGGYTGNGTSQTINCGFTTGARFFLVKTTSTAGSWWVFDSARGIVSAFDPALQLNSTAAEISSADAVDPDPMGIIVNQEATCSLNAAGVSYVYLAIS